MLKQKTYVCKICKTKPDQLSHHKSHLKTKIHQANKKIFELELSKLKEDELEKLYLTTDISIIVDENETFNNEESSDENVVNNSTKNKSTKKVIVKDEVDYSYLRLADNKIIFELDNDEKIAKIKKITNIIDNAHNLLYASESIVGLKALQIIMSLLLLYIYIENVLFTYYIVSYVIDV